MIIQGLHFLFPVLERGLGELKKTKLPDVSEVLDSYCNALFSKYPRTRYAPGIDSSMYIYGSMAPGWLQDLVMYIALFPPKPAVHKYYDVF